MFCPKCGAKNVDGAKFCSSCGVPLTRGNVPANGTQPTGGWNGAPAGAGSQGFGGQQYAQPYGGSPTGPALGQAAQGFSPNTAMPPKRRPWVVPVAIAACLVVVAVILLRVVGVSVNGSSSSKGGVAVMDGLQVGPVSFGGVTMGNTASNYANGAPSVSDGTYDYFYTYSYSTGKGGICRAAKDGSGVKTILDRPSDMKGNYGQFSLDGDTLFYLSAENQEYLGKDIYSIHSVKTDGSDDREIYTLSYSSSDSSGVYRVYLYDSRLYVVTYSYNSDNSTTSYEILTMDEDGSNQRKAGSFTTTWGSPFVTKDRAYYYKMDFDSDSDHPTGMVYAQNLDGSDSQVIYSSRDSVMYVNSPYIVDGKIYAEENNSSTGKYSVVCIDADGSNASTVYSHDQDDESLSLAGVTHGCLYVFDYKYDDDDNVVERAPLDGSATTTIPGVSNFYYVTVNEAGDHLLAIGYSDNGTTTTYTIDFNGDILQSYVN